MSLWSFITPGFLPTSVVGTPSNSQLEQMVQEAKPSEDAGMIVWSATAPDVVTYPDLALCVWGETAAGVPTGYFYTYNGVAWTAQKVVPGSISGASFADGSIGVSKLTPGTALYLLRTNAGATAAEWVQFSSLLTTNLITPAMLQNAVGAGYILRSGTGGVFTTVLLQTAVENLSIPIATVKDTLGAALANQVAFVAAKDGPLGFSYVESLLRDNQTPTNKLQFNGALAGKRVRVNTGGTNFEADDSTSSVARLIDTGPQNTAAQTISATTLTTLRLAVDGAAPSWLTVASNAFTLFPGTYSIEAYVPVWKPSNLSPKGYIGIFDATPTLQKHANFAFAGDQDSTSALLSCVLTVAATTTYTLKIYCSQAVAIGTPNNMAGIAEVYTQLKITRL